MPEDKGGFALDVDWLCQEQVDKYKKRIAELEREKQAQTNYAERLSAQVKELEAEVVSLKAAGRDYVELTLKQIMELEAELAKVTGYNQPLGNAILEINRLRECLQLYTRCRHSWTETGCFCTKEARAALKEGE
jgi:predicted RNase H-like nuclease (RuvC/YqgF family)